MDNLRKGLSNQAIGFMPILLFIFMEAYLTHMLSFIVGLSFSFICVFFYHLLTKDRIYQYTLIPSALSFLLYAFLLALNITPEGIKHSTVILEILFVVSLALVGFSKRYIMVKVNESAISFVKKSIIKTSLYEFFFISQIFQNLFTFHLFLLLFFIEFKEGVSSTRTEHFLYLYLPLLLGFSVFLYEKIRIRLVQGKLRQEKWLPVLNEKGRVVGSMAQSVSRSSSRKYIHPVVRIAVTFNGMIYLVKMNKDDYLFPEKLDLPYMGDVLFQQSIEEAVNALTSTLDDVIPKPRFLVRYTFENEKVKQLVSLFVISLQNEDQSRHFTGGKLWTTRQVEDNMNSGIFSGYFENEFPYLLNTVLLAESIYFSNARERK